MVEKEATIKKDAGKSVDGDFAPADKGEDTAALMRQLLSALEKHRKPGEPSKGKRSLQVIVY